MIRIMQIFQDCDLRAGEDGLNIKLKKEGYVTRNKLKPGEIIMFINRRRDIIKILGKVGMYSEHSGGRSSYDLSMPERRKMIFDAVGRCFGIELDVPNKYLVKKNPFSHFED